MRSSKSRSRSKGNRNRSMGNIVNRVFDSSGPEGKVRGTPQQIIDKYNQLARDAQLGNDRVATENFQQHAEHYLRMLAEAMREQQERQQQHQQGQPGQQPYSQGGNQGGGNGPDNGDGQNAQAEAQPRPQQDQGGQPAGTQEQPAPQDAPRRSRGRRSQEPKPEAAGGAHGDVIDHSDEDGGSGLVETPEERSARPRRSRSKPAGETPSDPQSTPDAAE